MEACGVPLGHGWENTIEEIKLRETFKGTNIDGLYAAFVEHVACGEKSVRMYDVGDSIDAIRSALSDNLTLTRLPKPRLSKTLSKSNVTEPELVAVEQRADGLIVLYGAIRRHDEQVEVDVSKLPPVARAALPPFDDLIAVRATHFESYGAIRVPNRGTTIEVRCDHFVGHSQKSLAEFHQKMYAKLHQVSGSQTIIAPLELFSAVSNIYNTDEGILAELGFVTTTGSVKHEKMRTKESLRKEVYHVGGKEALATEIEPFRLAVRWSRPYAGTRQYNAPELHLEGTLSMVGSTTPGMTKFSVRKAAGEDDFNWVRDKLLEYL